MTRAADETNSASLSDAMKEVLGDPDDAAVLVRAGPSGKAIALEDVQSFGAQNGLSQVAFTSPDGSIFRIGRIPGRAFPSSDLVARGHERISKEAFRLVERWALTPEELELVISHALARALAGTGDVGYAAAPSGRAALVLDLASDLITDLISIAFGD